MVVGIVETFEMEIIVLTITGQSSGKSRMSKMRQTSSGIVVYRGTVFLKDV